MVLKEIRVNAGEITTNSYIIVNNNEAMIIDPGGEPEKIIQEIEKLGVYPKYILLTHCHADHISGVPKIKEKYNCKILISKIDGKKINDSFINLAPFIGIKVPNLKVDTELNDNDKIYLGEIEFKIISTPGHTSGGISVYCEQENVLFSGDTLFAGSCRKNGFTKW